MMDDVCECAKLVWDTTQGHQVCQDCGSISSEVYLENSSTAAGYSYCVSRSKTPSLLLKNCIALITDIATQRSIKEHIRREAVAYLKQLFTAKDLNARHKQFKMTAAAYCLYASCRLNDIPITFVMLVRGFEEQVKVTSCMSVGCIVDKELGINISPPSLDQLVTPLYEKILSAEGQELCAAMLNIWLQVSKEAIMCPEQYVSAAAYLSWQCVNPLKYSKIKFNSFLSQHCNIEPTRAHSVRLKTLTQILVERSSFIPYIQASREQIKKNITHYIRDIVKYDKLCSYETKKRSISEESEGLPLENINEYKKRLKIDEECKKIREKYDLDSDDLSNVMSDTELSHYVLSASEVESKINMAENA